MKIRNKKRQLVKVLWNVSSVVIALGVLMFISIDAMAKEGDVVINSTNFPDDNFRNYIIGLDKNNNNILEESEQPTNVDLNNLDISDITGIELLSKTWQLDISGNNIVEMDLSKNKNLEGIRGLECPQLTKVILDNDKLLRIYFDYCPKLKELDVSKCELLIEFTQYEHNILGWKDNGTIVNDQDDFYKKGNGYEEGYTLRAVSVDPTTTVIPLNKYKLESLISIDSNNFPDNAFRDYVRTIDKNKDGFLDRDEIKKQNYIQVDEKGVESLKGIEFFTYVEVINCQNNNIKEIDVSKNQKLWWLNIYSNELKNLDLSKNKEIKTVYCWDNQLTSIDISQNPKLDCLLIHGNNISELDLSKNSTLIEKLSNCEKEEVEFYNIECISYSFKGEYGTSYALTHDKNVRIYYSEAEKDPVKAFVTRFYTIILQRSQINDDEIEYYTSRLKSRELDGCSVAKGFVLSPEYVNKGESDLDFVKKMYAAFFNREADAAQYYCDILASGASREVVLAGFVNSPEFKNLCAEYGINPGELILGPQNNNPSDNPSNNPGNNPSNNPGDVTKLNLDTSNVDPNKLDEYVKNLYIQILGRGYDEGGLQYWKEQIMAGTTYDAATAARVGFFESNEYRDKNKSNRDFVIDCYHAFLGREPEADGLTYWTGKLDSGEYSKQKVIDLGFGHSEEFKGILRGCGFGIIE